MRHIAVAIALIAASSFASTLTAATQYQGGGRLFPDELSKGGLPEVVPYIRLKKGFGTPFYRARSFLCRATLKNGINKPHVRSSTETETAKCF